LNEFINIFPVLSFRETIIKKGKKSFVWDKSGKKYLDLNSGQFCSVFGHSDDGLKKIFKKILLTIQHTSTNTLSEPVIYASKNIASIIPEMRPRTIFLATGSEAMECCLRYAKHLKEKPGILSFDKGYHGLTHGAAAYSMSRDKIRPKINFSYKIDLPNWKKTAEPHKKVYEKNLIKFKKIITSKKKKIAAVLIEPIISGGGFYFPPKKFLVEIYKICKKNDIFLIFDECQTGFGRLGEWFYAQKLGIVPDFIVAGKATGLGFPVACVIANGKTIKNKKFVMEHFSSHQNEPFAGELVNYLISRIKKNKLLKRNKKIGNKILNKLIAISKSYPEVMNARGIGLMLAFDISEKIDARKFGDEFCKDAMKFGLMLQHCNLGKTIRLLPNYAIDENEIDFFIDKLKKVLNYRRNKKVRKLS